MASYSPRVIYTVEIPITISMKCSRIEIVEIEVDIGSNFLPVIFASLYTHLI